MNNPADNYPNILIGCPVRNREWIISDYLRHLLNLNYPKDKLSFHFILNDSTDRTKDFLFSWQKYHSWKNRYKNIQVSEVNLNYPFDCGETGEKRRVPLEGYPRESWGFHSLSFFRNMLLDIATLYKNIDFIFSVDSDILVQKDSLKNLLATKKNIVAALIKNPGNYNFIHLPPMQKDRQYLPPEEVFKVAITGACMLVSKEVFNNKQIRYSPQSSGEDQGFCETARKEGYHCWVLKDLQTHVFKGD